jgi:hypothetical protein
MFLEASSVAGTYTFCTWNSSDGKGIIPAAALKPFSGTTGVFFYGQYNATSFSSGPYAITLAALPLVEVGVTYQ